jgi:hypothetical protein
MKISLSRISVIGEVLFQLFYKTINLILVPHVMIFWVGMFIQPLQSRLETLFWMKLLHLNLILCLF